MSVAEIEDVAGGYLGGEDLSRGIRRSHHQLEYGRLLRTLPDSSDAGPERECGEGESTRDKQHLRSALAGSQVFASASITPVGPGVAPGAVRFATMRWCR